MARNTPGRPILPLSGKAGRLRLGGLVATLAALIALPVLVDSPAAAATKTEKTFDSWTVVCLENDDQQKRCSMLQSRIRAQDKRMVLVWSITADDNNEITQSLTVPVGVSIKEGIRLFLGDGDPITLGYDVCGPRICLARTPLDTALVATVKSSGKASASYVLVNKQLMQVELDLTGFDTAYDYLVEQLSS
ncbi:invasion associated locus B family protein [Bauldia litoralis]|uniref:Invasion protein IalB, involved in pathogenesis n=1 Tax=Bauldia litoralis TaxID=665467 RepID=A0A1G6D655_9HYPH|nr:invasion associated locus B family protein [Bauldia litoralis]SDB40588.1 Invasion protein IalB, involved in pathogenesis [Bauldia litoralis]